MWEYVCLVSGSTWPPIELSRNMFESASGIDLICFPIIDILRLIWRFCRLFTSVIMSSVSFQVDVIDVDKGLIKSYNCLFLFYSFIRVWEVDICLFWSMMILFMLFIIVDWLSAMVLSCLI